MGLKEMKKKKKKKSLTQDEKAADVARDTIIKTRKWYDKGKVCEENNDDDDDFSLYRV